MGLRRLSVFVFAVLAPLASVLATPAAAQEEWPQYSRNDASGCDITTHEDGAEDSSCDDGSYGSLLANGSGYWYDAASGCQIDVDTAGEIVYDSCAEGGGDGGDGGANEAVYDEASGCWINDYDDGGGGDWNCDDGSWGGTSREGVGYRFDGPTGCYRAWDETGAVTEEWCDEGDGDDGGGEQSGVYDESTGCWINDYGDGNSDQNCDDGSYGSVWADGSGYWFDAGSGCSNEWDSSGATVNEWCDGDGGDDGDGGGEQSGEYDESTGCWINDYGDGNSDQNCDDGSWGANLSDGSGYWFDGPTGCYSAWDSTGAITEEWCDDGGGDGGDGGGEPAGEYDEATGCTTSVNTDGTENGWCDDGSSWYVDGEGNRSESTYDETTGCTTQVNSDGSENGWCEDGSNWYVDSEGNRQGSSYDEETGCYTETRGDGSTQTRCEVYDEASGCNVTTDTQPTVVPPSYIENHAYVPGDSQLMNTWDQHPEGGPVDGYLVQWARCNDPAYEELGWSEVLGHSLRRIEAEDFFQWWLSGQEVPTPETKGIETGHAITGFTDGVAETSYVITGLTNDVFYSVVVWAFNTAGLGRAWEYCQTPWDTATTMPQNFVAQLNSVEASEWFDQWSTGPASRRHYSFWPVKPVPELLRVSINSEPGSYDYFACDGTMDCDRRDDKKPVVTLGWQSPSSWFTTISSNELRFKLEMRSAGGDWQLLEGHAVWAGQGMDVLELEWGVEYTFRVAAFTDQNEGTPAEMTYTPRGLPDGPDWIDVCRYGETDQYEISWGTYSGRPINDAGSPFTGFRIQWWPVDEHPLDYDVPPPPETGQLIAAASPTVLTVADPYQIDRLRVSTITDYDEVSGGVWRTLPAWLGYMHRPC